MREIDLIHRQVELVAVSIGSRVRRLHDALEGLAFLTKYIFRHANPDPQAVAAWMDRERFEVLETGFFEQRDRVERARAAGKLPGESVFVWSAKVKDHEQTRRRFYMLRELAPHLASIHQSIKGIAWIYYQDGETKHATMVAPALAPDAMIPSDFDWHAYHSFTIVDPKTNPERRIRWSPPNVDYAGTGLISCASIPLWEGDRFLGVWTMDVGLSALHADLSLDVGGRFGQRQISFLIDYGGRLLAHPSMDPAAQGEKGSVHDVHVRTLGGDFAKLDPQALAAKGQGELELTDANGERLVVSFRAVPEIEWIVFATFPKADMLEATQGAFKKAFERLGSGDLSFRLDAVGDENMQKLVASYNEMTETLQESLRRRDQAEAEKRKLAMEQERLGRELEIAASIQLAMLPRAPRHPHFEFAGRMKPATEVGGDFYDVLTRSGPTRSGGDEDLWITIGDVSSHGLGAGLVMMIAQAAFQSVFDAAPGSTADDVLRRVNRLVHMCATKRLGGGRYVTSQVLLYRGDGAFECAGSQLWPLVIDPRAKTARRVECVGPWLGIVPELPHVPVHRFSVAPGEVLCLYSDGIIEARDRDGRGYDLGRMTDKLVELVSTSDDLDACAEAILEDVERWAEEQDDDRTILLVRRTG